jgi:lysophospholipase L1-like esterase
MLRSSGVTLCMKGVTVWSRKRVGLAAAGAGAVAAIATAVVCLTATAAPAALVTPVARVAQAAAPANPASAALPGVAAAPGVPAAPGVAAAVASGPVVAGPVVALGDSYTAGDLLPLNLKATPLGCARSAQAYPTLVANALKAILVDAACTGAGVQDMASAQQTYLGTNSPQLNVLAPDDAVVMLTLGGDDMGFWSTLDTCMELSVTDLFGSPCERHFTSGGTDQLTARIAAEAAKITTVLADIRARAPRARIVVVGYPDLFPQRGGCWPAVPITSGDIAYLRSLEIQLNAMLAADAAAEGDTFADTYTPTIGHDFCQSAKVKDVEGLIPTSLAYPFHPNARGQAAMAAAVLAALRS